jgi:hypothetical protein
VSAHTPGPWSLETVPTVCGICHKVGPMPAMREGGKPGSACLYVDYPTPGHPVAIELQANARLIAAAPDLLDALELLLREEEAGTVCEIDRQTARAAVAKAKGEI